MFDALWTLFGDINWLQPSWDMFIVLFFIVATFIYATPLGRDRLLVILVSTYIALGIVKFVPFFQVVRANISINDSFAFRVSIFLGMFLVLFFFLSQSALLRVLGRAAEQGSWWQVIMFAFLQVGLLISVTLSFLPEELIVHLTPLTRQAFVSDFAKAVWAIGPILAMIAVGSRNTKSYSM